MRYRTSRQLIDTKFVRFSHIDAVTLLVGPGKVKFIVHEDLIIEASDFFKAAFSSRFKEGEEKVMELPEDKEAVVDNFIVWLYKERFANGNSSSNLDDDLELFLFAEKCQVHRLKNVLVERFWDGFPNSFPIWTKDRVKRVYDQTGPSSGLRRLLAYQFARTQYLCSEDAVRGQREFFRHVQDFGSDVALEFLSSYGAVNSIEEDLLWAPDGRIEEPSASHFFDA